jgi:hypothetical protein
MATISKWEGWPLTSNLLESVWFLIFFINRRTIIACGSISSSLSGQVSNSSGYHQRILFFACLFIILQMRLADLGISSRSFVTRSTSQCPRQILFCPPFQSPHLFESRDLQFYETGMNMIGHIFLIQSCKQ